MEDLEIEIKERMMDRKMSTLKVGDLELNKDTQLAVIGSEEVQLTEFEFLTLWALAEVEGQVISRNHLRKIVGRNDFSFFYDTRATDKLISRLRTAIGDNGSYPRRIITVRGKGYKLVPKRG